jgi:uncharacterized protein DUF6932
MNNETDSLPSFRRDGLLPPGEYELTIEQLLVSALVVGPSNAGSWNANWRRKLVENLALLTGHLVRVGIAEVFIDGSFVENKDVPNDIDGYFVCDAARWASGQLIRDLQQFDAAWTWDHVRREPFRKYPKSQLPMWHKYRVELFPDYGQFCGLFDDHGRKLTFAQAFRISRGFLPKGIVKIGGLS